MFGGHDQNVVRSAGYREIRHIERLGINLAIHRQRKYFSKAGRSHRGRSQECLTQILAGASVIVVIRSHRHRAQYYGRWQHLRACGYARIRNARSLDGMSAGVRPGDIDAGAGYGSDSCISTRNAVNRPIHRHSSAASI